MSAASDLRLDVLQRKAGCTEACSLSVVQRGFMVELTHSRPREAARPPGQGNVTTHHFSTVSDEWVTGIVEWLRGLKHG